MENKKRFMEGERIGHMEDLLVSTILDPCCFCCSCTHSTKEEVAYLSCLLQLLTLAFKSLVETQLDGEESETEQSILPSPQSEVDKYLALPQLPLQRRFIPTSSPTLQEWQGNFLPCMHPLQVPSVCFQQQARCMMDKIRTPRRTRCPYSWRSR